MQLSRHSPSGVQEVCSPISSDVPLVIWHMRDGFLKKLVNSLILSVILENSPDLSSSVYIVFSFNYINIWEIQSKLFNGNGIFINPLHMIIQYSTVLLPPPALISHRDQEKLYNDMIHTDILPWIFMTIFMTISAWWYHDFYGKIGTPKFGNTEIRKLSDCFFFFSPIILLYSPFKCFLFPFFQII